MSLTIQKIFNNLNQHIGDSTENRVSNEERYNAITEATTLLMQETKSDMQNATYEVDYYDSVNYYQINNVIADMLASADLRVTDKTSSIDTQSTLPFTRTASDSIALNIAKGYKGNEYAIERRDNDTFLVINLDNSTNKVVVSSFEEIGGWSVTGEGVNLELDTNIFVEGSNSLKFNLSVGVPVVPPSSITNSILDLDLTTVEDTGSFLLDVFVPEFFDIETVTIKVGTDSSNYWIVSVTNAMGKVEFDTGWNLVELKWSDTIIIGTPDITDIKYVDISFTYPTTQIDVDNIRVDNFRIVNPKKLVYHFLSYKVGVDVGGSDIFVYEATTDIPFYSGMYDNYSYAVGHMAASILLFNLRLPEEAGIHRELGREQMRNVKNLIPSSHRVEMKSFKVGGINFNRRNRL